MPRNLKVLNGDINSIIQRGSKVTIQIGYDGNLVTRFTGYVSNVNAQITLNIDCQDDMWTLKQNKFTNTWKNVKVADIVSYIYTGTAQVVDLTIGGLIVVKQIRLRYWTDLKSLACRFILTMMC